MQYVHDGFAQVSCLDIVVFVVVGHSFVPAVEAFQFVVFVDEGVRHALEAASPHQVTFRRPASGAFSANQKNRFARAKRSANEIFYTYNNINLSTYTGANTRNPHEHVNCMCL